MKIVISSDIEVRSARQRQEFDPSEAIKLANDIQQNGLYHAPTVRMEGEKMILVAGERRLRAIRTLKQPYTYGTQVIEPGWIPVIVRDNLTDIQAEEIELHENIIRKDLTWQERADALARIHALRVKEGGDGTFRSTAKSILEKSDQQLSTMSLSNQISEAVQIAKHLGDIDVQKAKSLKEALSIVGKKLQAAKAAEIAKVVGQRSDRHIVFQGDSREVLLSEQLQNLSGKIDCIITDPPYGIDAHKHSAASTSESGYSHDYDDTEEYAFSCYEAVFEQGFRLTKPQAHAYVFCDFRIGPNSYGGQPAPAGTHTATRSFGIEVVV